MARRKTGGATQSRTGLIGFAIRCITALLSRHVAMTTFRKIRESQKAFPIIWSGKRDSNSRPIPWQGIALPTELFPQKRGSHYMDYELCVKKIAAHFLFLFVPRSPLYNAPLMNFGMSVPIAPISPSGEIGRHNRLKICRCENGVPVRFRSRAPN